jgi:hypothetical protein
MRPTRIAVEVEAMTKKRDLKRRVRARQEKTGESYTSALAHIREPRIPEAPDATKEAVAEGLSCAAVVTPELRGMGDLRPLFARVREVLEALGSPACGPLLRGETSPRRIPEPKDVLEAQRFLAAARKGERGLSGNGRLLALEWRGHVIVGSIWLYFGRKPLLQFSRLGDAPFWPEELWPQQLRALRRVR